MCWVWVYFHLWRISTNTLKATYRLLELVGDVVHGHPGARPGQRLPELLGPPQRLVDGARTRCPLSHILYNKIRINILVIWYMTSVMWTDQLICQNLRTQDMRIDNFFIKNSHIFHFASVLTRVWEEEGRNTLLLKCTCYIVKKEHRSL